MPDVLIRNGLIATMDRSKTVYRRGEVYIRDGRIAALGPRVDAPEFPAEVIDAENHVVLPGFVNTHAHLQQYFRGLYELIGEFYDVNLPLEGYRRPEDMETLGLASAAEFIHGGCTTALVIYTYPDGFASAVEKAGNRAMLAADIEEVNLARLREGVYEYVPEKGAAAFQRAVDLYERWHGKAGGRITTLMCPKAPDLALPETYRKVKEFARERGLKLTTHLAQSTREYRQVMKLYGKSPTRHLHDLGILDDQLLAAHCVYTNAPDEDLIRQAGTAIMQSRFLTTPLVRWLDMGIPLGLGTDDYYHDFLQLFKELLMGQSSRAALIEGAEQMLSGSRLTSRPNFYELLELATRRGAEALGIGDQVGSLEMGKKADIITINLNNPFLTPSLDPLTSVVLYGASADIDNVLVDGRAVKRGGEFVSLDLKQALAAAQARVEEIRERFFHDYPHQRERWEARVPYMKGETR
jgi:5-methylthioadenosine/S-adenosylhomocysteine deaminase